MLGYAGWQLLIQLPTLLVLVTGLVLALTRRLPRGPRVLLLGGVAVLLLAAVVNLLWVLVFPHLIAEGWSATRVSRLSLLFAPIQALLHPAGLALVIGAALAGRRATGPEPTPPRFAGWPAPGTPPAPVPPPRGPAA
ncbi:hypothetical protein [Micromonospora fulviviridis]|uniref:Lycopene cyclase domain-containing protein n=1 Tax=Micromonospora fulviviridis TaxID=47860 RepID=A0ABV2VK68_9ACTN